MKYFKSFTELSLFQDIQDTREPHLLFLRTFLQKVLKHSKQQAFQEDRKVCICNHRGDEYILHLQVFRFPYLVSAMILIKLCSMHRSLFCIPKRLILIKILICSFSALLTLLHSLQRDPLHVQ